VSAPGSGEAGGGEADSARRPARASGYSRRRVVRVPASSANLGPGFDSMAAALGLHLELEVRETGRFAVQTDLAVARGRTNLCVQAFERLHPADRFTFTITSQIPLAGGFGSSAAATVAGLMAADHLFELDADLLTLASQLEGHPDNAAAALNGGFVICADGQATRFDPPTGLEAIAVVPDAALATRVAREALPAEVPLREAVFNIAHGALLTLGLAKGDWDLVARGLHDSLHQRRRAPLFPRSYELALRARELGALGATISGAGPTVLVWCFYEQTGAVADALGGEVEGWARLLRTPFEAQGAYVEDL
jgi:homoserine kinase